MKPVYKREGASLTLHCMVQSEPPAGVMWFHPKKGKVSEKRELEIATLNRGDSGVYTCTASVHYYDGNKETDSKSVEVFVNC